MLDNIIEVPFKSRVGSLELTERIIREHAYQMYLRRGCEDGHDVEDWLEAEAMVYGKKKPALEQRVEESDQVIAAVA